MDLDTLLIDTFAAHEGLAPDQDAIRAGAEGRIDRRPSATRPRALTARPLAIAASVAVVAGTAATVVAVDRNSHGPSARGVAAVGSSATPGTNLPFRSRPLRATESASAGLSGSAPDTPVSPLTMPFDIGGLPDGPVHYLSRGSQYTVHAKGDPRPAFAGVYDLTVTTADGPLDIDAQQMAGGLDQARLHSGPGTAVTIDGRPGIEGSGSAGYELYFIDPAGGLMYVNVYSDAGAGGSAAQLEAIGRTVARSVSYPGTATVEPTYGVGPLPDGLRVLGFDVQDVPAALTNGLGGGLDTSYTIGTTDDLDAVDVDEPFRVEAGAVPGRDVQGHRTRYLRSAGELDLYVLGALGGRTVRVGGAHLSLAEAYVIADGLVLPR